MLTAFVGEVLTWIKMHCPLST